MKISRTNSYNIEIPIVIDEVRSGIYSLYKFDPVEFITTNLLQYKDFASLAGLTTENTVLKSFEAFSSMYVRGVYVSNAEFQPNALPREMSIKTTIGHNWCADIYYFDICKGEIKEIEEEKMEDKPKVEMPKEIKKFKEDGLDKDFAAVNKKAQAIKKETEKRKNDDVVERTLKKIENADYKSNQKRYVTDTRSNADLKEMKSDLLDKNMVNLNQEFIEDSKEKLRNIFKKEEIKRTPLLPDPMMHLSYVLGFTALNCPRVQFNSCGEYETSPNLYKEAPNIPKKKQIYFTSGTTLIKYDHENIKQSFFFGHSKSISNFILACNGEIIFSNQEGTNSLIRVWKAESQRCIKMLTTPFDKIKVMSENKNSQYLCVVGNEQNRETIIVYDISNLDEINVFIRQCSPSPISCVKFSPFEPNVLVSCGRENIKFWRIKKDHLSGKAIVLNQYGRGATFLCMDFNNTMFGDEFCLDKGKVYIGSDKGSIFQIACNSQELEAVYKIQNAAILSLAVNEAFCATGSQDGFLRLWPVDFSEFLIEAKHDSGVCSVDISYDAMDILCGTLNGSIGILNVQSKQYKTVLRSPPTLIKQMVAHPSGNFLFTIEDDMSVRIWDIEHKSEAFQFLSTKDPPKCIAAPNKMVFACGFESGILKIFDLDKTEILYECKSFQSPVTHLVYIQNDKFLVSMSAQGNMSIHDTTYNYIQSKILKIDQAALYTDISLSIDGSYFATIGPESNCALVWNAQTFGMKNRVPVNNFFIQKVCLINKNLLALVLENCCVKFYSLCAFEGIFVNEMMNIHIHQVNQFLSSKNYKFLISGGEEGMIKIWDMKMIFKQLQSYQQFIGHSKGVKAVLLLENKSLLVSASENSGIYFWNFLGDITFTETEITQEMEKLGDVNVMKEIQAKNANLGQSKGRTQGSGFYKIQKGKGKNMENTTSNIRIKHMEKAYQSGNPNMEILKKGLEENEPEPKGNVLSMLPVVEDTDGLEVSISSNDYSKAQETLKQRTNGDWPIKNSLSEMEEKLLFSSKYLPEKKEKFILPSNINPNSLSKKLCVGLSINSMKNLVFNKEKKWYAFTVNNKIIIEFLESERKEKILCDTQDELSCLILSPDNKYLIAGVGSVNRDEYAAILPYDAETFQLKKKLNFHFRGVQKLAVSSNEKYMVSIGSKEEKSLCIWHFNNLTVIDSKSVKFPIVDLVLEAMTDIFLYFITISTQVVSFWKMDRNLKLEGFHIKFYDLTTERDNQEWLTSLELTPYFEQLKTSFLMLGTNMGNIFIVDKETKNVIRKYKITKFPLTHMKYCLNCFTCCGEGPIIFNWKFNPDTLSISNIFEFFEKEKANMLFIDGDVCSMCLEKNGKNGLLTTDQGSIFFINFEEKAAFRIISSHTNCKITHIECDMNNENVITCGKDGSVRCWTLDTFDQKFQLQKPEQIPEKALLNYSENILIIQYDSSYLRLYNLAKLKSLGMIKIPNFEISEFALVFNNHGILLTTHEEKIFIVDVQNWEPLSVLYSEVIPSPLCIPKNYVCHCLETKNISNEKSYAMAAYSNGLVITFLIEKNNGKVEARTIDSFNMIEFHMSKTEDDNIKEMYKNLTNYRSDYICKAKFSEHFDSISLCLQECLQFLFVRNYNTNQVIKMIPLNYFPTAINLSADDRYIGIGTKEGLILIIKRIEENYNSGFNLDVFDGHFDSVDYVAFSQNGNKFLSTSYNEMFVWEFNN
ncbi:MAG: WD40 repeat domain-containing protein [archaeon]|nr:WD40 repeat domain-containing protein [archaeon]